MNLKHISAAAAAAVLAIAATPAWAQLAEGVAAIVNDHVISTFDVRQRANMLIVTSNLQNTPEMQQRARSQALRDLVDEQLQMEEATKYKINVSEDDVNRRLTDIARQNNSTVEALTQQLANDGVNIRTLRAQIAADTVWNRLISGKYGSRLRISETDIRETQERIAANATKPQYQISEIFLPADTEQEFNDMNQGAMRLLEQMQRGAPFPLVARQFSRSPSAAAGGDLGWIAADELQPEIRGVADRLEVGRVSLPIRTPTGVYLIAMRDKRAGAEAGATNTVSLRQVSVPVARQSSLERTTRRLRDCDNVDDAFNGIDGSQVTDLGTLQESDVSPAIRDRISNVAVGHASNVVAAGDQANAFVVCARATGGGGVPSHDEIERRMREDELNRLAERYLRDLRREATIVTRQQ